MFIIESIACFLNGNQTINGLKERNQKNAQLYSSNKIYFFPLQNQQIFKLEKLENAEMDKEGEGDHFCVDFSKSLFLGYCLPIYF